MVDQAMLASAKLEEAKLVAEQGARYASAKLERVSVKLKDFAEPHEPEPPCFTEALANATTALAVAQKALGDAVRLVPADCCERAEVLAATHDQLSALTHVVQAIQVGAAARPSVSAVKADYSHIEGEGDVEAAASEVPPTSPEEAQEEAEPVVDLLGGLGSSGGVPAGDAPSTASMTPVQPSLEELLSGVSASAQLAMAVPLMPEGAGGGDGAGGEPAQPPKRLKLPEAMDAQAPHEPEESHSAIERRVSAWQEGKNLRAMLATLHEIAPRCCRWQPRSLGELLDEDTVRDAYKLATAAMHSDKLPAGRPEWERARAQMLFYALRQNKP